MPVKFFWYVRQTKCNWMWSGASDNPVDFLQNTTRSDHLKMPPLPSSGSEPPSLKKILFGFKSQLWHEGTSLGHVLSFLVVQGSLGKAHGLSFSAARRILVPWPRIEPTSPTLQGRFLTSEPPGKLVRQYQLLLRWSHWLFIWPVPNQK